MARHLSHEATSAESSAESSVRTDDAEGTRLEGLQEKVFQDRYALKNEQGTSLEEFPEQMWRRVARGIASVEPTPEKQVEWSEKFYDLLRDFKFVPGGRILSGAGTNNQVTYYNCYVVGLGEDPLNPDAPKKPMLDPEPGRIAFFDSLMQMTDIMSRSGGVGINLSSLPPRGTPISVDGRGRNGAVRPTVALSIGHPDIELFFAERDGPNLQHVDLAVVVPPDFDQALAADADWTPQWNDWRGHTVKARDLWDRIHADEARPMHILRPETADLLVDDSRFSIVEGAAAAAMMLYRGERPVVDLSRLRPKGAYIKTVNGTSSGPVAWMYLYDAVARGDDGASPTEKGVIWYGEIASVITGKTIQQGGSRRGALMIMLDDDHPDIEEFIAAKRIDPQTNRPVMIEHANMSLCLSDAFMAAVKADLPWDLKWQGTVVRTVRARDIWDQICTAAWNTAEPGVVFMQRAREQSPMWYRENIRCTNPCVTGETLVYTADGLYSAAELARMGTPVTVTSAGEDGAGVSFKRASHVFATGVKPVYRLRTHEGYTVRLTANHRVLTTRGWIEAQDLRDGDKIRLLNDEGGFGAGGSEAMGLILGWLVGDGHITDRGHGHLGVVLSFWGEDRVLAPAYAERINQLVAAPAGRQYPVGVSEVAERNEARIGSIRLVRMIDPVLLDNKMQVPPSVLRGSREMQRGFLQALFSADGSVQGSQLKGVSVRLSASYLGLLEDVQRLLLNFGIASTLYAERRPEMSRPMPDGKGGQKEYVTLAQHELVIACANLAVFAEKIGFLQQRKQEKLTALLGTYKRALNAELFVATFAKLIPDGEEMVYDLTEPESHLFVGNGITLHNCGEQPIPAGAVCNLGALNLARFVTDEGELLEDDLARDAAYATRFLDDVVDATPYFSELHVKMQREGTRRVGLGTMGLADALIKLRVAYGSADSLEAIGRIYTIIRDAAYRENVALAEEKGACGFFDRELYPRGSFIQQLPQDIQQGIREHGVRNGVVLTQAPTGTTSLLAGVSSGIEPVFSFATKRVDRIGEHLIYHSLFQAWLDAHPDEQPPDYFVTAHDLTPEQHVAVQARVQQYTDSSISKTSNAPHDHTVEDVKRLYALAYELGCKGVTYYRDGSRDAVLTAVVEPSRSTGAGGADDGDADHQPKDAEEATMNEHAASEESPAREQPAAAAAEPALVGRHGIYQNGVKMRPEVVSGYTRRVRAPEGNVNVTLNSDEDGLLEVFVNIGKAGSDVAALAEALGRLISLHLRLDSPISQNERAREVARQLGAIGGSTSIGFGPSRVRSLPDAVARALEAHLSGSGSAATPDTGDDQQAPDVGGHAAASGGAPANSSASGSGQPNGHGPNPGTLALYTVTGNLCPQCGNNTLYMEEGCKKCVSCGHSEC